MSSHKILLTGATGFIGSFVLDRLLERGFRPICILRDPSKIKNQTSKSFRVLKGDLSDEVSLSKVADDLEGVSHVIHIAALMPKALNRNNPRLSYEQNLITTINLMKILPDSANWFCYASSIDVYGTPGEIITEQTLPNPSTYYGASKLASENFLKVYCRKKNVKLAILRPTQVYGPRDSSTKLIPSCIRKVLTSKPVTIYGKGEDLRDYIYVEDAAEAFVKAAINTVGGTFNIATGKSYRIIDVAENIKKAANCCITSEFVPTEKIASKLNFNVQKAMEKLSFQAKTTLEEGIEKTLEWHRNN